MVQEKTRCPWGDNAAMLQYHDEEWGRPMHDEGRLFEMLILEGQQAGLSWAIILNKRENYRKAYDGFDPHKIALYGEEKVQQLLGDASIIRNRLKVQAVITNAKAYLAMLEKGTTLDAFLWGYVEGKPIVGRYERMQDMPAKTELSDKISKDMKKLGFKFIGSTIIYSYLQAIGIVNDHIESCFAYGECIDAAK